MTDIIKQQQETETTLAILRGEFVKMGGKGSGNWRHRGRKGKRGGSLSKGAKGGSSRVVKETKQEISDKVRKEAEKNMAQAFDRVIRELRKAGISYAGAKELAEQAASLAYEERIKKG